MKRLICLLLAAVLVMSLLPALASGTITPVMRVAHCSEWVSLREYPSTSAARLEKVGLGELVTDCEYATWEFIECQYNGKTGYIQSKYLEPTNISDESTILPNQMVVNVEEFVNLLSSPSPGSRSLARVPVCAVVTSCELMPGDYVYCVYQGSRGYIPAKYLHKADTSVTRQDTSVISKYSGRYPAISGPMEVVNCEEWVSLRQKPSKSALRLARVRLGVQVTDCIQVSDTFIYCCYRGVWGYIQSAYLMEAYGHGPMDTPYSPSYSEPEPASDNAFDRLPAYPTLSQYNAVGSLIGEFWSDPQHTYQVIMRNVIEQGIETCCAAVFDAQGGYVTRMCMSSNPMEPESIAFFAGGTAQQRLLICYSGTDLTAYRPGPMMADDVQWSLLLNVGTGMIQTVDSDGTVYLMGYYTDALAKVSPNGELVWQVPANDQGALYPYEIDLYPQDRLDILYSSSINDPETETVLSRTKSTGELITGAVDSRQYPAVPEQPAADSGPIEPAVEITLLGPVERMPEGQIYVFDFAYNDPDQICMVLTAKEDLVGFKVLALDLSFDDNGDFTYSTTQKGAEIPILEKGQRVFVKFVIPGDSPACGFAYLDGNGDEHTFALDTSAENGQPEAWEINR